MPLIPTVGRKSLKMRIVVWFIYITLAILGVGMVYPFLMTVTASVSGPLDYDRFAPAPRSLWSRDERFAIGLTSYFPDSMRNGMQMLSLSFDDVPESWTTWRAVGEDKEGISKFAKSYLKQASQASRYDQIKRQAADYDEFASTYPLSESICTFDSQVVGPFFRYCFRALAKQENKTDDLDQSALEMMSASWGIPLETFYAFKPDREFQAPWDQATFLPWQDGRGKSFEWLWQAYRERAFVPSGVKAKCTLSKYPSVVSELEPGGRVNRSDSLATNPKWTEFTGKVIPMCETRPYPMKLAWVRYLGSEDVRTELKMGGGGPLKIEEYNKAFGTKHLSLRTIPFPIQASDQISEPLRRCWAGYVSTQYPRRLIELKVNPALVSQYRAFIKNRCHNDLKVFNDLVGGKIISWEALTLTATLPENDAEKALWMEFVGKVQVDSLILHSAEADYQKFLKQKYGSLASVNNIYGWNLVSLQQAEMPVDAAYLVTFVENERPLYAQGLTRNYRFVFDYLFNRESAVRNTIILIGLSLLAVLTVNPLAAYALSRYQMKQTSAIILFLLATMAFPVAVSMIPGFLLMRDLHMLNTYAALILPGLANGYSIFLLKGFFDSLPNELYEAATLDGAKEWTMFMKITRPLSTPILAVIALNCFMATYSGWEWALVVCQKQSMWTVSVWLYKFSIDWAAQPWLVMASFVIASIPVFLVFLLCQNIILRGIILPQMK